MTVIAPAHHRSKLTRDIELSLVDYTAYNPVQRRQNVDDLAASLKSDGQLEPAHLVYNKEEGRYTLADGNRRSAALKQIGSNVIRAHVYTAENSEETQQLVDFLFTVLNTPKMTLKNGQMLQAALQGGPTFNTTVRSSLNFLLDHFTPNEIEGLVKDGAVTPTLLSNAKRIAGYCVPGVGKDTPTYFARVRKTLYWLLRHKVQQEAIAYMRLGYSSEAMKKAIDNNQEHLPRMAPPSAMKKQVVKQQPNA